ncbi:cell division protein DedD [Dickeya lacustris]|uniref:Cell division protein DedD n=1 Tax=Dickeya lacustris TaxID=2259638 RepID=A0ABY8GA26_9GAMM|nr:cell division protein DedD [Dickeya lacustris]WFN56744.1 cell division protein DedD [Dickeya lacustris]
MASKFQNRLAGTVVLVALGVIVLPGLLDGKKKHYEDEFAAIPLVPKPGDALEAESLPPVSQSLPSQPPEGAAAAVQQGNDEEEESPPTSRQQNVRNATPPAPSRPLQPTPAPIISERQPVASIAPPALKAQPVKPDVKAEAKPEVKKPDTRARPEPKLMENKPADTRAIAAKPETRSAETPVKAPETKSAENKAADSKLAETKFAENKLAETKPVENKPAAQESSPAGQAFVVQLGALKNADKVNEVVAKLRLSGYRAYTVPSTPVAGQITRIYVGPDASKQKLQSALGDLQQLSGLSGQVRAYNAH